MITHRHLKTAIDDYCVSSSKDLFLRIVNELRYSNLYIPSIRRDGKLAFDIYSEDNCLTLTPLFTDLDEVKKFYKDREVEVFANSLELYRNVLLTSDIEGYILNPASERYLLDKELILKITDFPKTTYVSPNPYAPEELKALCETKNKNLEDFIKNHVSDYEALFELMASSTLLAVMISESDLSTFFKNGILNMQITGPVASMYVDEVGGRYAALFSSKEKISHLKRDGFKYVQVINLSMLVNYVLSEDMDGIILNPSGDDVLISRHLLLNYSLGFERFADDERLSDSIYYIFEI